MPQYAPGQLAGWREAESSNDAYPPGLAPRPVAGGAIADETHGLKRLGWTGVADHPASV